MFISKSTGMMMFRSLKPGKPLTFIAMALLLLAAMPVAAGNASIAPDAPEKEAEEVKEALITRIEADTQQKHIRLWCLVPQEDPDKAAVAYSTVTVNIAKDEMIYEDVYVKNVEKLSGNTLLITVQPPLQDALYGIGKRNFIVQLGVGKQKAEASKTAILGSAIRILDLRAYATPESGKYILNALFLALGFSLVLALIIPVLKRYTFKKHHIKKYQHVKGEEEKEALDPFTFETVEDTDEVVLVEENIMLLRSWKRLHKLRGEKSIEALEVFFQEDKKSNLFKPQTKIARRVNRMWFGMIGAYMGWLLYVLLMKVELGGYRNLLAAIFDTDTTQFSSSVYGNVLLAVTTGLAIGIAFIIADRLYGEQNVPFVKMLYRVLSGTGMLVMFLLLASFINIYFVNDNFWGNLVAWLCIGAGLGSIASGRFTIKKRILMSVVIALAGFTGYQLGSIPAITETMGTGLALVAGLLVTGSILGGVTHAESASYRDASSDENTDRVKNNDLLAVQVDQQL